MLESGKIDFIWRKSYEISYALFRISANITEKNFAHKIAEKSVELISLSAEGDSGKIAAIIPGLKNILYFTSDIGLININNRDILIREIDDLSSAIAELPEKIDIADIFSQGWKNEEPKLVTQREVRENRENNEKSEIRQSIILERLKQMGNCRLGDILAIMPGVSERTIRYDLESLIQKGMVERVGSGGRGTHYKIASGTQPSQPISL